ncbi:MAG TPA: hypothetical protein VFV73_42245 [Streptosporangiaceae bacterium]|nr:hypothetical protein [Streptosporangiaceae bacterium]
MMSPPEGSSGTSGGCSGKASHGAPEYVPLYLSGMIVTGSR